MKNRLLIVAVLVVLLVGGGLLPGTVQAGAANCHLVRPGENLSKIAAQYGVTLQAMIKANNLRNPNLIYVGQCLVIPQVLPPPPGCTVTHVVRAGEYLEGIALRYGVAVRAIVDANGLKNPNLIYPGQRLLIPVRCQPKPTPPPTPKPTPAPGAWKAQYWANRYLSGDPKLVNYPASIAFNWGQKGPGGGVPGTGFSARFTQDKSFDAGRYRFRILVDDGVRFWLDGILLIDKWQDTPPTEYVTERQLSAGVHSLQIDYYQNTGEAQLRFTIELINGVPAWTCQFFDNTNLQGTPVATAAYNALSFDWGNNAPVAGVTADYFSARCTGNFSFVGGKYQFTATVDDGVRVFIGDNLVIDQWHLSPPATYNVDVDVGAGTHPLKVEYFENNGIAVLKLRWTQR